MGAAKSRHETAPYDDWAEYYDLIHRGLPGEAEFYVGQAVRHGGKVLELGCGTGRIAIPAALCGLDVTGLDNSKPMLDRCRIKKRAIGRMRGTLRLVHADMADCSLGMQFDFIMMAYRTFMHLLTPQDQERCLTTTRDHLADGGRFVLNLWVPKFSAMTPRVESEAGGPILVDRIPIPHSTRSVLHYCSVHYDEFRQLIIEEHLVQEVNAPGTVLRSRTLPLVRAWITPREMAHLVKSCGFRVEALLGDFDGGPFTEKSMEMVWVLGKA